jgi:hypothetical protein
MCCMAQAIRLLRHKASQKRTSHPRKVCWLVETARQVETKRLVESTTSIFLPPPFSHDTNILLIT